MAEAVAVLDRARTDRRQVHIFGNGGSASTASHFACDLAKGTISNGKPRIRVRCLSDNTAVFSAWANDTAYELVFAEQLKDTIEPGDVAIAISGSGNSPNVLRGVAVAREAGATTIGLCGFNGGKLAEMVDIPIIARVHCMEQVEDIHLVMAHAMAVNLRSKGLQIIAVTNDARELAKVAEGYLPGGRYGKAALPSQKASAVSQQKAPVAVGVRQGGV
jgi:D-sedoheptulose 7-phosphate isomerase